ncbi:MAG: tRNA (adenosine(37)-N6)-threonylcarbamoyltransferase complex dimerization subunit type 1 TsaB [Bacteroidetes bacterium HGW-Bacteroidetes-15]|nr:MAG: tRNA (adenosine(37)-N6)-threonylcarbamoyltransferase complex dimerization subunit type 1 TsaB [Bacteroidetes bacterium HGW-Bacteroidetes-15]
MSKILCIESGTNTCSVALGFDQEDIDIIESHEANNNHARNLTQFVKTILDRQGLKAKDLSAVAISKGPGSYTGLRIGVSAAKGICYGAGVPLISVGSLDALTNGAISWIQSNPEQPKPELFCPMIDARRMEVYTQLFLPNGECISEVEAKILDGNSFNEDLESKRILFFGNGSNKAVGLINSPNASFINEFKPSARFMITIASRMYKLRKFEDVAYFEPLYLKDFVATIAKNKVLTGN